MQFDTLQELKDYKESRGHLDLDTAVEHAAKFLPDASKWNIRIDVENGAATVTLEDVIAEEEYPMDIYPGDTIAEKVVDAIVRADELAQIRA